MRCEWKKMVMALALAAGAVGFAQTLERAQWQALVGESAQNPQTMKQTMAKLSDADQLAFVSEVNSAISKMPGSDESKAAAFYAANRAAVTGASKSNLAAVLAEVYATVPPEYLTEINERFATDVFSRTANPSRVFTDQEFTELSTNTMAVINARLQTAENTSVREAFAALMFVRASGGTPADLAQTLVSQMPDSQARENAGDWIKAALGDGQAASYDAMLGAAQAGEEPDHALVTQILPTGGTADALLANLAASTDNPVSASKLVNGVFAPPTIAGVTDVSDIGLNRIPRSYVENAKSESSEGAGPIEPPEPYYRGQSQLR